MTCMHTWTDLNESTMFPTSQPALLRQTVGTGKHSATCIFTANNSFVFCLLAFTSPNLQWASGEEADFSRACDRLLSLESEKGEIVASQGLSANNKIAACFYLCPTLVLEYEWRGLIQSNNTSGCFLFKFFVCGIFGGNSQLNVFPAISKCHISSVWRKFLWTTVDTWKTNKQHSTVNASIWSATPPGGSSQKWDSSYRKNAMLLLLVMVDN